MRQKYEYKFIRLGVDWLMVRGGGREHYQEQIQQQAQEGWRLVQVFAPGIGGYGAAKYYELILEREIPKRRRPAIRKVDRTATVAVRADRLAGKHNGA